MADGSRPMVRQNNDAFEIVRWQVEEISLSTQITSGSPHLRKQIVNLIINKRSIC